jgi:hypothetical protein
MPTSLEGGHAGRYWDTGLPAKRKIMLFFIFGNKLENGSGAPGQRLISNRDIGSRRPEGLPRCRDLPKGFDQDERRFLGKVRWSASVRSFLGCPG